MIRVNSANSTRIPACRRQEPSNLPLANGNPSTSNWVILRYAHQTAHPAGINCQLTTINCLLSSTYVEDPLQIRPFRAKQTQFPKQQKSTQLYSTQRVTTIKPLSGAQKQTQNEPNQSQYKPNQTQFPYAQQNEHNFPSHKGL
jgi:hypothetical protein